VQRGPSFPETMEVSLDRKTGSYKVRSVRDGREDASSGSIDLPPDVYNGMAPMLLKNLEPGGPSETVHVVAFTPKPRLIELEMVRAGNQRLLSGDLAREATRYALKPMLGSALRLFATLLGKAPVDQECVILTEDVPAFVRCDGPLYLKGPVWRIEGTSARSARPPAPERAGGRSAGKGRAGSYARQREYPQPPPPSRNNTKRTINKVVMSHHLPPLPFSCDIWSSSSTVRSGQSVA
jgi:hypothetical protein